MVANTRLIGGRARQEEVRLECDEWELVVAPKMTVLGIHIPASGPLDSGACRESVSRVKEFFETHYPEVEWSGLLCHSWLLDDFLWSESGPEGNIQKFANLFCRYPVPKANDAQMLERLFLGIDPSEVLKVQARTRMQKEIQQKMVNGQRAALTGGIIMQQL